MILAYITYIETIFPCILTLKMSINVNKIIDIFRFPISFVSVKEPKLGICYLKLKLSFDNRDIFGTL